MIATFLGIALFLAAGNQVADVDLSAPPKVPAPTAPNEPTKPSPARGVRGRGRAYDGGSKPLPGTPPISVRLDQILSYMDRESGRQKWTLEVVVTNTGKTDLSIPVGDDSDAVLADKDGDRRCLGFEVRLGDTLSAMIGYVESVSNSRQPLSIARLEPGDTVRFRLPFDKPTANNKRAMANDPNLEVTVRASLHRMVMDHDMDWEEQIGDDVRSENSLPFWP
ncbi:MAG: hypothetical protein ABSF25_08685 [Bryobacteraceae bacterium]|jgi:hypothetical protein